MMHLRHENVISISDLTAAAPPDNSNTTDLCAAVHARLAPQPAELLRALRRPSMPADAVRIGRTTPAGASSAHPRLAPFTPTAP